MEHLWSRAGANSGNGWQMRPPKKRLKPADPQRFATQGNFPSFDGKEGVDGSSRSRPLQRLGLAREWRAPLDLHGLSARSRLTEPALLRRRLLNWRSPLAFEGQSGAPPQPCLELGDRDELQPAAPDPANLRSNVPVKENPSSTRAPPQPHPASTPNAASSDHGS
jgi:hypothetical protein